MRLGWTKRLHGLYQNPVHWMGKCSRWIKCSRAMTSNYFQRMDWWVAVLAICCKLDPWTHPPWLKLYFLALGGILISECENCNKVMRVYIFYFWSKVEVQKLSALSRILNNDLLIFSYSKSFNVFDNESTFISFDGDQVLLCKNQSWNWSVEGRTPWRKWRRR